MTDRPTDRPTDEHGPDGTGSEPDLTPEQEQEVRRLLVDARELEPMPDSVAARLDRVLAELSASPAAHTGDHPADHRASAPADHPVDLPARPAASDPTAEVTSLVAVRRQRAGRLLLAAAAVVVVGIGLGQVLDVGGSAGSGDSALPAAESQADAGAAQDRSLTAPEAAGSEVAAPTFVLAKPVRVDPERFSADVERARRLAEGTAKGQEGRGPTGGDGSFAAECSAADWGGGTFVPVRYAGDAGVLVFRAPEGDSQVVDLFQCGSAKVLRSITLPTP